MWSCGPTKCRHCHFRKCPWRLKCVQWLLLLNNFNSHITLGDGSVHRCPVNVLYLLKLLIFANQALSSTKRGHKEVSGCQERECADMKAFKNILSLQDNKITFFQPQKNPRGHLGMIHLSYYGLHCAASMWAIDSDIFQGNFTYMLQ